MHAHKPGREAGPDPLDPRKNMTAARIIWVTWCLLWTALWSVSALAVLGDNPYAWQLQYGNDQRHIVYLGFGLALASAAAILAPVGGPSPTWARQLAAWAWRERPAAQARRYPLNGDYDSHPDQADEDEATP